MIELLHVLAAVLAGWVQRHLQAAVFGVLLAAPLFPQEETLPLLSPERWDAAERQHSLELTASFGRPKPEATGTDGMVVGTTGALAVRAGVEALAADGSAMDAALTTALAEIVLSAGSWNSFAGITSILWFDADSGEVFALDGSYGIPWGETDPSTIPTSPVPSGRSALVPGVPAAFEEAHRRFGRLPMREVAAPAIWLCEEGFPVYPFLAQIFQIKAEALSRREDTRTLFAKEDGSFPGVGDVLRQPALAAVLKRFAAEGAADLYRGEWAEKLVQVVQEEGGRLTAEDLADYRAEWTEPLRTEFRDCEIVGPGLPTFGGVQLLEAFNLIEQSGVLDDEGALQSGEALYWLIQFTRAGHVQSYVPALFGPQFAASAGDPAIRVTREHAERLWQRMQEGSDLPGFDDAFGGGDHSDAVIAVDADGNVCAMIHTINTSLWGATGIFVDGVSIPDSACFQQQKMAVAGPGGRVPSEMNPALILEDGIPVLASSCIGGGLIETSLQAILRCLLEGATPKEATEAAHFLGPAWTPDAAGASRFHMQGIEQGAFPEAVLEEIRGRGQELAVLPESQIGGFEGWWIGITLQPDGTLTGGAPPTHNGLALGLHEGSASPRR